MSKTLVLLKYICTLIYNKQAQNIPDPELLKCRQEQNVIWCEAKASSCIEWHTTTGCWSCDLFPFDQPQAQTCMNKEIKGQWAGLNYKLLQFLLSRWLRNIKNNDVSTERQEPQDYKELMCNRCANMSCLWSFNVQKDYSIIIRTDSLLSSADIADLSLHLIQTQKRGKQSSLPVSEQ